jgi:hypothetical protein
MFMRMHAWIGPILVCCTQFMLHAFYVAFYTARLLCSIHLWGIPCGKRSKVYYLAAFIPTHALLQHTLCEGWVWSAPNQTMPCQGKLWWCLPPSLPATPFKKTDQQVATTLQARTKGAETVLLGGSWVGLARTIHLRCIYGNFGRLFIIYTVMYNVYIQFWPTLIMHTSFSLINVGSSFHCLCVGMARTTVYTVHIRYFWRGIHQMSYGTYITAYRKHFSPPREV